MDGDSGSINIKSVLALYEYKNDKLMRHLSAEKNSELDGMQAKLTFVGEPGKLAHFGPTTVQGNETVSDRVILRQVTFKPGDVYRRSLHHLRPHLVSGSEWLPMLVGPIPSHSHHLRPRLAFRE